LGQESQRFLCVFFAALGLYGAGTHTGVFAAGNDASRWAHIESLVDYGTPSIEASRFGRSIDRVLLDGREYSNKPPLVAIAGAALYAPLQAVTGWRLGDPETAPRVIWMLTVLLVGLPAATTVALFDRALRRHPTLGATTRVLTTVALAAGTLLFSFAVTLNNHVLAALLLLVGALAAFDARGLVAGLAVGLAAGIDLLPGLGFLPIVAMIVLVSSRSRSRELAALAVGAACALTLFVAGNMATTGSPLPPKMVPGAVDLAAQAGPSLAGVVLPQDWTYPLEVLFGSHGLLLVSPVLIFGVLGLVRAVRRAPFGSSAAWAWMATGIAAQYLGHALVAGSYGGWSYGYRYLLPIQPLLLLAAPAALESRRLRRMLVVVLPISVAFSALGAYHPWPPAFEQRSAGGPVATLVHNPVGGNAAAWAAAQVPETWAAEALARRFVDPDPELQRRYFALFFASRGDLERMQRFTGPRDRH
jgi:hypothetical protein